MRRFTVTWQTFADALPPREAKIVVEVTRETGMLAPCSAEANQDTVRPHKHTSECVTGAFGKSLKNGGNPLVTVYRKHGDCAWLPLSNRWYLQGSERLETAKS